MMPEYTPLDGQGVVGYYAKPGAWQDLHDGYERASHGVALAGELYVVFNLFYRAAATSDVEAALDALRTLRHEPPAALAPPD